MLTLAFESSAKAASVALVRDGSLISQYSQCSGLTHSRTLLPMAEDLLKNAELTLQDVDLFAVAHGPGSFTGIRIGVSTVKGLAWATNKPCVGVSTLEAMAWHGLAAGGFVCPVMDARRSQVYNALFEIRDGAPVRLTGDRPISLQELAEEVWGLQAPVFLVGDGAELTARFFAARGIPFTPAPENLRWQSAWGVAMAARGQTPGNADSLLPVYLRLSQAERERQERLAAEGE
jgi:tRNA threonylcarbamoyladenosine biosynthesis protein TsaB